MTRANDSRPLALALFAWGLAIALLGAAMAQLNVTAGVVGFVALLFASLSLARNLWG